MHLVTVAPSPLLLRDAKTKPRSADDRSPPKPAAGGQPLTSCFWKQRGAAYTYTARDPHELPWSKTEGNCLYSYSQGNRREHHHIAARPRQQKRELASAFFFYRPSSLYSRRRHPLLLDLFGAAVNSLSFCLVAFKRPFPRRDEVEG